MRTWLATLVLIVVLVVAGKADGSELSRARTREGYALAYDLRFAACYEVLEKAVAADPSDPAPPRAIAAVTWMEILFAQGVATYDAFTGEISKGDVVRPAVPPALTKRFRERIEQARRLAKDQLARADTADAHYQIGATKALSATYGGTVDGRLLGSFDEGRDAVAEMERVRAREPGNHEAALVLGMSQYTISTMSWFVRGLARLGGLSGNREAGLALLHEAATAGADTESDALLLLMIIDNREGRHADAIRRLEHLERRHPHDRLLWLNHGAAALEADRPLEAERVLSEGLGFQPPETAPTVLGEAALWYAQRGMARARLRRHADAIADLERGLASDPREWVRGQIHAQLGDLALARGERAAARREYETAIGYSDRGGDKAAVRRVRQQLSALKR